MQRISRKIKKLASANREANGNKSGRMDGRPISSRSRKLRGQSNKPRNGHVENEPKKLHGQGRIPGIN